MRIIHINVLIKFLASSTCFGHHVFVQLCIVCFAYINV